MKLTLKHPVSIGKQTTIDHLTFREHTIAADYLAFDQRGGVAQNLSMIAALTGQDEEVIKRLHGVDYHAAVAIMNQLLDADLSEPAPADFLPTSAEQKK